MKRIKEENNVIKTKKFERDDKTSKKMKDMLDVYEKIREKIKNGEKDKDLEIHRDYLNETNAYLNEKLGLDDQYDDPHVDNFLGYFAYLNVKISTLLKQIVVKELGRQIVFYEEYEKWKAKQVQEKTTSEFLFGTRFFSYDVNDNQNKKIRAREVYPSDIGRSWLTKPDETGYDKKIEDIVRNKKIVPFYITSIFGKKDNWRTVSFDATIDNLNETFNPDWDRQNFFGRTEPLNFYTNTQRNLSLGFKIIPISIEDLPYIYKKLDWLAKLTYVEYDDEGNFQNFPIIRLKVGDLWSANGNRGLAGIFTDLSYDYAPGESTWEIIDGLRVPKRVDVSFNFGVIHDEIPSSNKDYHIFKTRNIADTESEKDMDNELKEVMKTRTKNINSFLDDRVNATHSKFWDEIQGIMSNIPAKIAMTTDAALRDKIQTESRALWRKFNNEV